MLKLDNIGISYTIDQIIRNAGEIIIKLGVISTKGDKSLWLYAHGSKLFYEDLISFEKAKIVKIGDSNGDTLAGRHFNLPEGKIIPLEISFEDKFSRNVTTKLELYVSLDGYKKISIENIKL